MRSIITKELAEKLVLNKYDSSYDIKLVGSLADPEEKGGGRSYNDIDIVITIHQKDELSRFMAELEDDDWKVINKTYYGQNLRGIRYHKKIGVYEVDLVLYPEQYFQEESTDD